VEGNEFDIYGGIRASKRLEDVLEGQMSPHFSPIHSIKNLGATIRFHSLDPDRKVEVAGLQVTCIEVEHGAAKALSFRIQEGDRVLVYASDVGYPGEGPGKALIDHFGRADVLIHDCTYSPEDHKERRDRGFSSIEEAARAAVQSKAGHLVMIHYDQDYTDDDVDRLKERTRTYLDENGGKNILLTAAAEGLTIDI
jgi:ribonuclease BN (tRNA processing enzyme)